MRVGFAGTPEFAARALAALVASGHTIPLVLTQPDRPHGRGMKLAPSAVKALALTHALPLAQPATLRDPAARAAVLAVPLDVLVVAAYGLILPPAVLAWPRFGCLNIHASRLPRWRGAAPIQRALEAGDTVTGVTIMQMDAGLDTGPIVATTDVPIGPADNAATLHDALAVAGATAIVNVLATLVRNGRLETTPQPADGVTYAAKITAADAVVDWRAHAVVLARKVRALDPVPGAAAALSGHAVKLRAAAPRDAVADAAPGTVVAVTPDGVDVACGPPEAPTVLRVADVQPAGGKRMSAAAFARGHGVVPGMRFDLPD